MSAPAKPRLLFVGAFVKGDDGLTGGTYVACSQLLHSPLTQAFDVLTIDTSQPTARSRRLVNRALSGIGRVLRVAGLVLARRVDAALIFATLGPSWLERGAMAIVCRLGGVRAFLFPRCAEVNQEIEEKPFVRGFTRLMASLGVDFLFQGDTLRERFLRVIPSAASRTHVLLNWIDLGWSKAVAPLPSRRPPVVLYMGWLHPLKGVDILIEGLARHAADFRDCKFVFCGDGSERAVLEEAARRSGVDCEFRGWVHDGAKAAAFSDAQIVVLPSRVEGMPNVLLEAMSAGRPVVATDVGSVADLVRSGIDGVLIPAEDPDALAAALRDLLRDPDLRARYGASGRAKIERDHNLANVWRKLASLLDAPGGAGADPAVGV